MTMINGDSPKNNVVEENGARAPEADLSKLVVLFERMRLADYICMLQNPRRLILLNFLAGLSRGLGVGIGMTLLLGLVLYTLHKMIDMPFVGAWIGRIVDIVQEQSKNGL